VKNYLYQGVAVIALASSLSQVALAQQVAANTAGGLETVIVSATKIETDLQRTPIAISVISSDQMTSRHAESLISLADGSIPSLRVAPFESRQSALVIGIRGIVPFDANQTARDQGVGVYIDGVYQARPQGLNAALFDLERIEVLRGPQGTLFGRNTEGGALSIVTKAPTGVMGTRIAAGTGNFGSYGGEIHQDFPKFYDVAVKVDALVQHQDPTTRNPMSGQAGWNQYDRRGIRASALFQPSEKFSALISADYTQDENTPFFSQLISFNPYGKRVRTLAEVTAVGSAPAGTINPLAPLVQVRTSRQDASDIGTVQQPSVDKTRGVSATLKYEVTPNLELRSITSARGVSTKQWDNSGIEARNIFSPNANFGRYSLSELKQSQFSQEFQAAGSFADSFTYVVGAYYFNEHVREEAATPFTNVWNADGTAFTIRSSNGTYGTAAKTNATQGWEPGTRNLSRGSEANSNSAAVFGQGTYTPASIEELHLTVGGRYTQDKRHGVLYTVAGKATNFRFNYDSSRFDPMATVAYDLSDYASVYAKFSTGYRAGGANSRSQTFQSFGAEEVNAYEVGAKMDLLDQRLRVNLAAYRMDRSGTQTDFDNVDTTLGSPTIGAHTEETRNSPGISKIMGFEADLTALLTDNLTAGFSYAYTDVNIPAAPFPFTGNTVIPQGTPFPVLPVFTPQHAVSGYLDYQIPAGAMTIKLHLDANYSSRQYSFQSEFADVSPTGKLEQSVNEKTDPSFLVNANVALADIGVGSDGATANLSLWSRNLLDREQIFRRSVANRGTIGDYANFNAPRTFGVELRLNY